MEEIQEEESVLCAQPELVNLFLSYIVGDVDSDDRNTIEKHLAECAACREDMKFLSDLQHVGEELFGDE